jgi:hypothetical protein
MATTEDLLIEQIATMQKQIIDHEAQLRKMWTLHGLPTWKVQEKQRWENEAARGTRQPFSPTQHFGEKTNNKPLAN